MISLRAIAPWAWTSRRPGITVLPLTSRRNAPAGTETGGWATTTETTPDDQLLGRVDTPDAESAWRFSPDEPWAPGRYEVVIATILEDLAGNNLKNLFDVDLGEMRSEFAGVEAVYLPFVVAGR